MTSLEMAYACEGYVSEMTGFATMVGLFLGCVVTSLVWALTLLYRSRKS